MGKNKLFDAFLIAIAIFLCIIGGITILKALYEIHIMLGAVVTAIMLIGCLTLMVYNNL